VQREVIGVRVYGDGHVQRSSVDRLAPPIGTFARAQDDRLETAPATEVARRWSGWGTALKPAHEPICVARRPLSEPTVAANVLRHGTGGINVDACRVAGAPPSVPQPLLGTAKDHVYGFQAGRGRNGEMSHAEGRWPSNVAVVHKRGVPPSGDAEGAYRDCWTEIRGHRRRSCLPPQRI
jgi:hypothetical protein